MRKRIRVNQLRVGMYVADVELSGERETRQFAPLLIASDRQVKEMMAHQSGGGRCGRPALRCSFSRLQPHFNRVEQTLAKFKQLLRKVPSAPGPSVDAPFSTLDRPVMRFRALMLTSGIGGFTY
jgi:hypothetical protein